MSDTAPFSAFSFCFVATPLFMCGMTSQRTDYGVIMLIAIFPPPSPMMTMTMMREAQEANRHTRHPL